MVKIPESIAKLKVEQLIENQQIANENRPYLGLSGIGDPCARKLWYGFRWVADEMIEPRVQRLLSRGHKEEPIIVEDLEKIGVVTKYTVDDQMEVVTGYGHIKGHCDGHGNNIPDAPKTTHLLEFKTANDKNFKIIKNKGYRGYSEVYYGQVCCYMYLMKLKRALVIVVNKNTDERHYERIHADNEHAKDLIKKGEDIIQSKFPFPKIGNKTWYQCKWCKFKGVCHFGFEPLINCRTCEHTELCDEGIWWCEKNEEELSTEFQRNGCAEYQLMGGLCV